MNYLKFFIYLSFTVILIACSNREEDSLKSPEIKPFRGDINSENFTFKFKLKFNSIKGDALGTLFELVNEKGEVISSCGFNNGINTYQSLNKNTLSFFFQDALKKQDYQWEDLGNPFPKSNRWSRIFTFKGKLLAHGQEKQQSVIKEFDTSKEKWFVSQIKSPDSTQEIMDVFPLHNELIWVLSKKIVYKEKILFEETSKEHVVNMFGLHNGNFFIYSYSKNNQLKNKIYYGQILASGLDYQLKISDEFEGLCENPTSCGVYGWSEFGDDFCISTNFGHLYQLNKTGLSYLFHKKNEISWQLYGFINVGDSILSGHYPTGNLLVIKKDTIHNFHKDIPIPEEATEVHREAQTLAIYSGKIMVGLWPWGEIWGYNLQYKNWRWINRAFEYPLISEQDAPFVSRFQNYIGEYNNLWGQRIIDLVPLAQSLYINTAFKNQVNDTLRSFLAEKEIEQYGKVYKLTLPGQITAEIQMDEEISIEVRKKGNELLLFQNQKLLGKASVNNTKKEKLKVTIGKGIYGNLKPELISYTKN